MGRGRLWLAAVTAAAMVFSLACGQSSTGATAPIKIGMVDTFSGSLAGLGTDHLLGARIAVSQVNASGGVLGRQIQLVPQDDQATSQVALQALRNLNDQGVHLLVAGGTSSAVCLDETKLLAQLQELQISPGCAVNSLTETNLTPNFFRTSEKVNQTVAATAGGVCKTFPNLNRVDTLELDVASAGSGIDLATTIFAKCGAKVTNRVKVPSTATDFLPYLTNLNTHLAADSADNSGLYMWVFGAPEINAVKQGVALGLFKKYKAIFSNVNDIDVVANALGPSMPTVYATLYYYPTAWTNALNDQFVKDYQATNGRPPNSANGTGFNAVMAYVAAIKKANTDDYTKVQKALEGLTFDTLQGHMTIDAKTHQGDVTEAIVIFSAQAPKVSTTVNPGQL